MGSILAADGGCRRQCVARRERIGLDVVRKLGALDPRQRVERQAVAHRRVAREQIHALVTEEPATGLPAAVGRQRMRRIQRLGAVTLLDRQRVAHLMRQALGEDAAQPASLHLVVELGVKRVDVDRQTALTPEVVPGVLVARLHMCIGQSQASGQPTHEGLGIGRVVVQQFALVGEQRRVVPAGLAIGAPANRQRPARQLLARVPLALAVVQEATLAVMCTQPTHQVLRHQPLGRAQRVGIPLGAVAVLDADEGGLATHRQPHVARHQLRVHLLAQCQHLGPLVLGVRLGDARRLEDAGDRHLVVKLDLALVHRTADRRRAARRRRAGHRNMAFAGHQSRSRVETDPARAGQEDLAPGVQVGEIDLGATGAVERLDVGFELDQVARDEARGQPEVAQRLHQQPTGVAATSRTQRQRFLGRLHARLHPDQVADVALQALVDADQEVDGAALGQVDAGDKFGQFGRRGLGDQVGLKLELERLVIAEGVGLGVGFEEEVEGVVDRHLGHQVDGDLELGGRLRKHQPRQVVGERVLLPVDEMVLGLDRQRVTQDLGAAMRRRTQTHDMRPHGHRPVILVVGDVVQRDVNGHGVPSGSG